MDNIYLHYPSMPTCKICNTNFPNRTKIGNEIKNIHNRKYCLECSPWGLHNTRQLETPLAIERSEKYCPRCKTTKSVLEFYRRRRGKDFTAYCKKCTNNEVIERQRKFKRKCIEYKGGKCEKCMYDKCDYALEFHHTNPKEKDFGIANARLTTFSKKIMDELDKCVLLCSNCHREEHAKLVGLPGFEPRIKA